MAFARAQSTGARRLLAAAGLAAVISWLPAVAPAAPRGEPAKSLGKLDEVMIFPGSHYVTPEVRMKEAVTGIAKPDRSVVEGLEQLRRENAK